MNSSFTVKPLEKCRLLVTKSRTYTSLILVLFSAALFGADTTNLPPSNPDLFTNPPVRLTGTIKSINAAGWVVTARLGSGKTNHTVQLINPPRSDYHRFLTLAAQRQALVQQIETTKTRKKTMDLQRRQLDLASSRLEVRAAADRNPETSAASSQRSYEAWNLSQAAATESAEYTAQLKDLSEQLAAINQSGYVLTKPYPVNCLAVATGKQQPGTRLKIYDARAR